ncbi:hypothetical protein EVG20_g2249 [Dentipellis fragilis]|uniref:Uncharacterized protein n=1 Tax=Dentipellis fragilis TaxID=205917 RepID=A0A4Y9Z9Q9_9AGAM|nr:hypothetical protein EVG20_g2249 [Dentipellis fragilis]
MVKHNVTVEDSSPLVVSTRTLASPRLLTVNLTYAVFLALRYILKYRYGMILHEHSTFETTLDTRPYLNLVTAQPESRPLSFRSMVSLTTASCLDSISNPFSSCYEGTGIYVFGTIGPQGGTYNVSLFPSVSYTNGDTSVPHTQGNAPPPETRVFSSRAAQTFYQQPLFTYTGLNASIPHHLEIGNYGFGEFILDFIVVENDADTSDIDGKNATVREITLDDSHTDAFSYTGIWSTDVSQNDVVDLLFNETQHMTTSANASTFLKFRGSGVAIHGQYSKGTFLARLDNEPPVLVKSSYSSAPALVAPNRPRELLFAVDGLVDDNHELTLTNMGDVLNVDFAVVSTADPGNMNGLQSLRSVSADNKQSHTKASPGLIVGAVVACLALLLIAGVAIYYIMVRRRRRRNVHPIDLDGDGELGFGPAEKIAPWDKISQPPDPQPFLLGQPIDLSMRRPSDSSSITSISDIAPIPPPLVPEGPAAPPPPPRLYQSQAEYVGGPRGRAAAFPTVPMIQHEDDAGLSLDPATPPPVQGLSFPRRVRARREIPSLPPLYNTSWGGGLGVGIGSPGPKSAFVIVS